MAGIGAAFALRSGGELEVTVVERERELGGLAGSFVHDGAFYPLGYHHILPSDRTLSYFLAVAGASAAVRWRRVRLLFWSGDGLHALGHPAGLLRFPMPASAKAGLMALSAYAFARNDWSRWEGRSAEELIDAWGGRGLREHLFEPLTRLKFDRTCAEVSAAWLGARLHSREGASRLGYIPGTNWTKVLCDGLTRALEGLGCELRTRTAAGRILHRDGRVTGVELESGEVLSADALVSTVPAPVHRRLLPDDATPEIAAIRYTALLSLVCATRQPIDPEFYWLTISTMDRTAGAIFDLTSLNPSIGHEGETCLNFVTHLADADAELFRMPEDRLMERYLDDARAVLGVALESGWRHLSRIPLYSPIFDPGYRNPPLRSTSFPNLYYAGNHCTHPSVASTGTALGSGLDAARALLGDSGAPDAVPAAPGSGTRRR